MMQFFKVDIILIREVVVVDVALWVTILFAFAHPTHKDIQLCMVGDTSIWHICNSQRVLTSVSLNPSYDVWPEWNITIILSIMMIYLCYPWGVPLPAFGIGPLVSKTQYVSQNI